MGFLRSLFGPAAPPDIDMLRSRGDVSRLIAATSHQSADIQQKAIEALKSLGAAATARVLQDACSHKRAVRLNAGKVAERIGWDGETLEDKYHVLVAQENWGAIRRLSGKAVPILVAALNHRDRAIEASAAATLASLRDPSCVDALALE